MVHKKFPKKIIPNGGKKRKFQNGEITYRTLFEGVKYPMYSTTVDGDFIEVNDYFVETFGYSHEDLDEMKVSDLFKNPESRNLHIKKVDQQGYLRDQDLVLVGKNGTIFFCKDNSVPVRHQGEIIGFQGILQNITKKRETETQLKILESAVKQSSSIVIITDSLGSIKYVNPKFCEFTGYSEQEAIGSNPNMLRSEYTPLELFEEMWDTLNSGEVWRGRIQNKKKNGETFWVSATITPVKKANGEITDFVAIETIIDKQVKFEEQLKESIAKFKAIFEEASVGIALVDQDDHFIDANPYFLDMISYELEELQEITFQDISHPDDVREKPDPIDDQVSSVEKRYITKEGNIVWGRVSGSEVSISDKSDYYILVIKNITKEKLAAKENKRLQEKLIKTQRLEAIGQLAGGVAHDFNNLLAIIKNNHQIIRMTTDHENILEIIEDLEVTTDRASKLISKLLNYAQKSPLELETVDIHSLLDEITTLLKNTMKSDQITIQEDFHAEKSIIKGDHDELSNSIMNVLINAKDAIALTDHVEMGIIKITTNNVVLESDFVNTADGNISPGNYLEIEISDNGIGIEKENQSKIFEPFYSTKNEGTGLGLASCYGTVISHNGIIQVDSVPNEGTSFQIYLPVFEGSIKEESEEEVKSRDYSNKSLGILIIDDEKLILKSISRILESYNHQMYTSSDPKKGIEIYQNNQDKIDVIILDLLMPTMDGMKVLKRLQDIDPDIKVIIYSGYIKEDMKDEFDNDSVIDILNKPFNKQDLLRTLNMEFS